jgi:hypothetical protein
MTYLDPTLIETLLQEGALRRGVTVVAYRALIQATADGSGASFEQALQLAWIIREGARDFGLGTAPWRVFSWRR